MKLRQLARLADSLPPGRSVAVGKDADHLFVRLGDELPDGFDMATQTIQRNPERAYVRLSQREAALLCLGLESLLADAANALQAKPRKR